MIFHFCFIDIFFDKNVLFKDSFTLDFLSYIITYIKILYSNKEWSYNFSCKIWRDLDKNWQSYQNFSFVSYVKVYFLVRLKPKHHNKVFLNQMKHMKQT